MHQQKLEYPRVGKKMQLIFPIRSADSAEASHLRKQSVLMEAAIIRGSSIPGVSYACSGFGVGAYFSKTDWHSENYWWSYFPPLNRHANYDLSKYANRWGAFVYP